MSGRPHPVTPAVYRPAVSASSRPRKFGAPSVYRPAAALSAQRKLAVPPVYVPPRQPSNVAALPRAAGRAIQPMRMTQFDTSGWSTGLTGEYDEIHFKTAKPKKKAVSKPLPVATSPVAPVTTSAPVARPVASLNLPWKWDEDYGMQTSRARELEELRKSGSRLPMWLGEG